MTVGATYEAEAFVRFDNLSLPAGSTITSATLTLTFQDYSGGETLRGYYLLQSWDSSTVGWTNRDSTHTWNTAGAKGAGTDRSSTEMITDVDWTAGGDVTKVYPLSPSVVQGWVDTPSTNDGIVLQNNDANDKNLYIHTSRDTNAAFRPLLTIEYTPSSGGGSTYTTTMTNLTPVAWWRLGDTGTTAADSSGNGHTGTFKNFSSSQQATSGAVSGDSDGAVLIAPASGTTCTTTTSNFIEVADNDVFSLSRGNDGFGRSVSAGTNWGTSDSQHAWAAEVTTTGTYYSVDSTSGTARINETSTGTWQQGLPVSRADADIQIKAHWSQLAAGGTMVPVALVARRSDNTHYYRAELREDPTTHHLDLRIVVVTPTGSTTISSATDVGQYAVQDGTGADEWWYLRFQLQGTTLKAKAWNSTTTQPDWPTTATVTDSTYSAAGTVSVRSTNSSTTSHPLVSFDDFRVQSVGFTVHAFMKPTTFTFNNRNYIHWMGKGQTSDQDEWALRMYPDNPLDTGKDRRVSGYAFNISGSLGAGAYFQDSTSNFSTTKWTEVDVVYDPGDLKDPKAGVSIYENGNCMGGPRCTTHPVANTLYSYPSYAIFPGNGTEPVRIGTRDCSNFFSGYIDEVAIFDYELSTSQIQSLYCAANPSCGF
ncbi:MAG: DNRLRE domain-containing protein [Deltaproteobacteria bacterium]|nr:DNRLRE domain-containing protein [Deltaproteobacteria bacterium]